MFSIDRNDFGPGFTFGGATAAYQIEGGQRDGRGPSIWDSFSSTPGNVHNGDTGSNACNHYELWPQDLDLIRDGGFDSYRFSFAWPRLIPEGTGAINQAGLDFYDRLLDGMLERNIKPYATLYHWDLPSALQDRGGWMNRDIAGWFADYAALVAQKFGDRLHATATINEPWCVAFLSHYLGIHAPGYRDVRAAARAMHHVLFAHGTAIDALRANRARNQGIVLNLEKSEAATDKPEDLAAMDMGDALFNRWYLGGVLKGQYPEVVTNWLGDNLPKDYQRDMEVVSRPLDWLGINYYTRGLYKAGEPGSGEARCHRRDPPPGTTRPRTGTPPAPPPTPRAPRTRPRAPPATPRAPRGTRGPARTRAANGRPRSSRVSSSRAGASAYRDARCGAAPSWSGSPARSACCSRTRCSWASATPPASWCSW